MVQTPPGEREAHPFNLAMVIVFYLGIAAFVTHARISDWSEQVLAVWKTIVSGSILARDFSFRMRLIMASPSAPLAILTCMKQLRTNLILGASTLLLSVVSFLVVMQGASDEPYVTFRKTDALVQVGVAMVLMLLWAQLAIVIVAGITRGRISGLWFAVLLWVFVCELYLFHCPVGYVTDITRYVARSPMF